MTMAFGLGGADIGSITDWANFFLAGAVFYLGWQAHKLAHKSAVEAKAAEEREGRVLLVYLRSDLAEANSQAQVTLMEFELEDSQRYVEDQGIRNELRSKIAALSMPDLTPLLPRLHTLGEAADAVIDVADRRKFLSVKAAALAEYDSVAFDELLHHEFNQLKTDLQTYIDALDRLCRYAYNGGTIHQPNNDPT